MADGGTTAFMIASLAMTAIGTGVSVYSSQEAAANERRIASYNAQVAQRNAELQQAVAVRQAQTAQYNARLQMAQAEQANINAEYQARVAESNAQTLRNYAASTEDQGREQARRMRIEKLRAIGAQRAQYAKGGVTTEGSPLAVLADTEGTAELQIADMWWQTNQERSKYLKEAEFKDFDAAMARANGQYESLLSMTAAKQAYSDALFEEKAAGAGYRIASSQAEIERIAGNNRADAYTLQGYSSLISGAKESSGTLLNYYDKKPKAAVS